MPSVNVDIIWPDGEQATYYSPSTIVHEHLTAGGQYSQAEFDRRIHQALNAASERVYQKFGYYCTAASAELEKNKAENAIFARAEIAGDVRVTQLR